MKKFKWTVEFTVDETWVADGFELTEERAKDWIENDLGYSYSHETAVKVLKAPSPSAIAKVQGYRPLSVFNEIRTDLISADRIKGLIAASCGDKAWIEFLRHFGDQPEYDTIEVLNWAGQWNYPQRIESLKQKARLLNKQGKQDELAKVIAILGDIWTDDAAAKAFYTELEHVA